MPYKRFEGPLFKKVFRMKSFNSFKISLVLLHLYCYNQFFFCIFYFQLIFSLTYFQAHLVPDDRDFLVYYAVLYNNIYRTKIRTSVAYAR